MRRRAGLSVARPVALVVVLAVGFLGGLGATASGATVLASGTRAAATLGAADPAKVAEYQAEGFDQEEALFLALTKVKARVVGRHQVQITESFPTGNQAAMTVTITPRRSTQPTPLKVQNHVSGGNLFFTLEYSVSSDALLSAAKTLGPSASGHAKVLTVLTAYAPAAALLTSTRSAESPGLVEVVVKGVVKKFVASQVKEFAKMVDALKPGAGTPATDLLKAVKSGLSVVDAFNLKRELDALMAELDALEKCAKNPTNPLTKKTYQKDPGEQNRVLKEIEATRAELKGNSAVSFIATLNKEFAGTVKGAPWLVKVIGPGTAWALNNFRQVAQDRMNELRKGVVPCAVDLKIATDGVTATKCGGPEGDWTVLFQAKLGGGAVVGSATATFTLAEGTLTGSYSFGGSAETGEGTGSFGEGGTVTYVASGDGTSGTLNFSDRGSYPVTVGTFCTNGAPTG